MNIASKYFFHSSLYKDKNVTEMMFRLAMLSGLFSKGIDVRYNFGVYSSRDKDKIDSLHFLDITFLDEDSHYSENKDLSDEEVLVKATNKRKNDDKNASHIKIVVGETHNKDLKDCEVSIINSKEALEELNVLINSILYFRRRHDIEDWGDIKRQLGESY